jgi:hypothetical protein
VSRGLQEALDLIERARLQGAYVPACEHGMPEWTCDHPECDVRRVMEA